MRKRHLLTVLGATALLAACDSLPTEPAPYFLDCDRVERIGLGQNASGRLGSGDCTLQEDGTYVDYYKFTVSSPRTVTLTMRSNQLDSYLFLLDENGDFVAEDDDSDPNSQFGSQIVVTLDAGEYYIGANSYDDSIDGDYTLYTY